MRNRTWIQVNSIDWCETGNAKVPCLSFTRLHESISSTYQVFSKILWELGLEPKKTWSTIFLFQSDKWYLISELDWRINMSVICIIVYDVNQTTQFKLTCAPIQIMLIIRMYKGKELPETLQVVERSATKLTLIIDSLFKWYMRLIVDVEWILRAEYFLTDLTLEWLGVVLLNIMREQLIFTEEALLTNLTERSVLFPVSLHMGL